jgi:hypothetical protein
MHNQMYYLLMLLSNNVKENDTQLMKLSMRKKLTIMKIITKIMNFFGKHIRHENEVVKMIQIIYIYIYEFKIINLTYAINIKY